MTILSATLVIIFTAAESHLIWYIILHSRIMTNMLCLERGLVQHLH